MLHTASSLSSNRRIISSNASIISNNTPSVSSTSNSCSRGTKVTFCCRSGRQLQLGPPRRPRMPEHRKESRLTQATKKGTQATPATYNRQATSKQQSPTRTARAAKAAGALDQPPINNQSTTNQHKDNACVLLVPVSHESLRAYHNAATDGAAGATRSVCLALASLFLAFVALRSSLCVSLHALGLRLLLLRLLLHRDDHGRCSSSGLHFSL